MLNSYYKDIVTKLLDNLKDESALHNGTMLGLVDALNTCV
jgi:hypothetical protein